MQVRDCRCRKAFAALAETVSRTAAGWIAVCCFAATAALGEVVQTGAAVSVTSVTCTRHSPWDGKVDVDYELTADDPSQDIWVYPVGYDGSGERTIPLLRTSGDGAEAPVKPGRHRMTVDVDAAAPGLSSAAFTVKIFALAGGAPYLVVDLSEGANATNYPVSYLPAVPQGGWTDEYKTTKLVLRLIPPGTFMMGSPTTELGRFSDREDLHQVTLTRSYYIGVFETTQKQWELIMGSNPSSYKGDMRPVDKVSYAQIRGAVHGICWPLHDQVEEDSFVGRLRRRSRLKFDLPTDAQWEHACRAGTVTALPSGKSLTDVNVCPNVAEIARYESNRFDGKGGYTEVHTTVGMYLPNDWGLYDVIGNICELCLDRWQARLGTASVTDPKGTSAATDYRVFRSCGARGGTANLARSARRSEQYVTSSGAPWLGFRIAAFIPEY